MIDNKFLGRNGFIWFNGVVEDRIDPEYLGRVRVRCIGFHTQSKTMLPTADLPWASVILPVSSAGISGLGTSPSRLVEGSWVFGYFRDGMTCQEPLVMGSLPGRPSELANTSKGFYDPNGVYPKYKDEVDTNRLAVNLKEDGTEVNPHLSLTLRRSTRITGVATADVNPVTAADGTAILGSDGDTFDQPEIPYATVYPYNTVYESESGHLMEYDDTSGAAVWGNSRTIMIVHGSQTSIILPTVTGEYLIKYQVVENSQFLVYPNLNNLFLDLLLVDDF